MDLIAMLFYGWHILDRREIFFICLSVMKACSNIQRNHLSIYGVVHYVFILLHIYNCNEFFCLLWDRFGNVD